MKTPDEKVIADIHKEIERIENKYDTLKASHTKLIKALEEISLGQGAYDFEPIKHAFNCIENMRSISRQALKTAKKL